MKRVINLLKNHLDWLDDHKNSKLAKGMENATNEIREVEKAIKILEESERQESTNHSNSTEQKALHIADVSKRISNLSIESKNKLFSIWMTKNRSENLKSLDLLFELDDIWNEVYEKYRIKEGFESAQLKANNQILSIFYAC